MTIQTQQQGEPIQVQTQRENTASPGRGDLDSPMRKAWIKKQKKQIPEKCGKSNTPINTET